MCTCIKDLTVIWMTYISMSYFLSFNTLLLSWKYVGSYLQIRQIINLEIRSIFKQNVPSAHLMPVISVVVRTIVSPLSLYFILSPVHVALFQKRESPECCRSTDRSLSLSHLSLHAGTSRGSHFTFDFYFPSQLNWPPEMWNFVKWDAPGGSHDANLQPAFVASVCREE